MQLIITTQYRENYGAHDWNGEGECPQYWKNKGGYNYIITDVPPHVAWPEQLEAVVVKACEMFNWTYKSDYSESYLLDWEIADDSVVPQDEIDQIEFYGKIDTPTARVAWMEIGG